MDREKYRQYLLSGTVSFPATLPNVAQLQLQELDKPPVPKSLGMQRGDQLLVAIQRPSPRVTMKRSILVSDARAVFLPRDPLRLNFDDGIWLLNTEIADGLQIQLQSAPNGIQGIVYVPEYCPSLLEVSTGLTAGESIQYYPPLPCDRTHNHYDCSGPQGHPPAAKPGFANYPTGQYAQGSHLLCEDKHDAWPELESRLCEDQHDVWLEMEPQVFRANSSACEE